jgi:glycine dehydrogenase
MLDTLGYASLDDLIDAVVPAKIRMQQPLDLPAERPEEDVLATLREMAAANEVFRSYIGMGYSGCFTPPVILRNILENPGWYTAYTPYQAEISQGRLEALLSYQTVVSDLTGLEIANASLLDEGTAAAEAMTMTIAQSRRKGVTTYLVDQACHPQTIAVVRTRAAARGIHVEVGDADAFQFADDTVGALVQYPTTTGAIPDYRDLCVRAHAAGALITVATDLLALTLLSPPGEWGADIAVGNSQRFGVPMGYGGPHAAFFATREEFKRVIPGRIIGVTHDSRGAQALRMALQTREQHIRRDKATSNVCTAQVLLAVVAGAYAVYHGPDGLRRIANRVHGLTSLLAEGIGRIDGVTLAHDTYFDTLCVQTDEARAAAIHEAARARRMNLREVSPTTIGISLDETTGPGDVEDLLAVVAGTERSSSGLDDLTPASHGIPDAFARTTPFLTHEVFSRYQSETEMLRYLKRLEDRDMSLTSTMIPLGSCTMKLNATTEMIPVTWTEFGGLHPFAPREQAEGYGRLFADLESKLAEITGFAAISLQPNAGSQGEFAGLLAIRSYHHARGDEHRTVCLIPKSAHGTNPASAVMAGMRVVVVATDQDGNIDMTDLRAKAEQHQAELGALMVSARAWRAGVHGRRQPQRHGRPVPPGRRGRRCVPPEFAQDVLHPARRRRSGRWPHRGCRASRALPPGSSGGGARHRRLTRTGVVRSVGQLVHSAHLLGVLAAHGRRGSHRSHQDRDSQRQLHRETPRGTFRVVVRRRERTDRPRVHPRGQTIQAISGCRRRGHRETFDGLRFPRPDHFVPGCRNPHGGADRERVPRRARPVLRRHDRDSRGDPGNRTGHRRSR